MNFTSQVNSFFRDRFIPEKNEAGHPDVFDSVSRNIFFRIKKVYG